MKLTVPIKLITDDLQAQALLNTIEEANRVCNTVAEKAWELKVFHKVALQKAIYYDIRSITKLSAQMVLHCIYKVCDSFKKNKKVKPYFRAKGSVAFDDRILSFKVDKGYVSIWTLLGRIKIDFKSGPKQIELLHYRQGESDLIYRKGNWFLHCTIEIPEAGLIEASNVLGVDLGIRNIAVTSDGTCYSGAHVNKLRNRHRKLRTKLQKKRTKSAKRLLRKRSGKERRFARNVNHIISKSIVAKAKCTNSVIAVENLRGIRTRVKVRKSQRATLHGWSFYQLQSFIEYKAKLEGILVVKVDPKRTSITCPKCGLIDKRNRKDRDHFVCKQCNYAGYADYVAAVNIAQRATAAVAVNLPNV